VVKKSLLLLKEFSSRYAERTDTALAFLLFIWKAREDKEDAQ
jgi:hypothetical protein